LELAALLARDGVPAWSIAWSYLGGAARQRLASTKTRGFRATLATAVLTVLLVGTSLGFLFVPATAGAMGMVRVSIDSPRDAAGQLRAQLSAHHFRIGVTQEPVSPSLVGSIVAVKTAGRVTNGRAVLSPIFGPCVGGGAGCTKGLVLPSRFGGSAQVVVGRRASRGEAYAASAGIFRPGELLACSDVLGETVKMALPFLEHLHVVITWDVGGGGNRTTSLPNGSYHVVGGEALSSGAISLDVLPAFPSGEGRANAAGAKANAVNARLVNANQVGSDPTEAHARHC
jgi:hypothetical protein